MVTTFDYRLVADAGYSNSDEGECWGAGAYCSVTGKYVSYQWSAEEVTVGHPCGSPYFELRNYVVSLVTWARLGCKSIELVGDCEPAVKALSKHYSPSPLMLALLRFLDVCVLLLGFIFTVRVEPRVGVCMADVCVTFAYEACKGTSTDICKDC